MKLVSQLSGNSLSDVSLLESIWDPNFVLALIFIGCLSKRQVHLVHTVEKVSHDALHFICDSICFDLLTFHVFIEKVQHPLCQVNIVH